MNKGILLTMLLLLIGVSSKAQSISANQMDERFNDNKLPYGWFTEGWEVDSTGVAKKKPFSFDMENFDITKLMGGDDSYNYLMTPPLSVKSGEALSFSAKKGGADAFSSFMSTDSDDEDSTFVVERSKYGEHMWIQVADFTTELDSVYKTFTISNTEPGEYRFRFRAAGKVEIDSVAGFHIDTKAPDIYPVYQGKNIQPIDLSVCEKDTTMTFSIINTATGTLTVKLSTGEEKAYTLDLTQASIAAADTAKVNLTFKTGQAHEGRNTAILTFETSDERVEKIALPIDAIISQKGVWVDDFNSNTLSEGWFTEGWEAKDNVATVKQGGGMDLMSMFGGSSKTYYLMTPPLKVNDENDVLLFSVKKPGGGGMDLSSLMGGSSSESSFFIEKSVYGSGKWEKAKDFTNALDTVFTTQWLSGIEPGEYRFRFVASDSIVIDSVAGFQIDMKAPDLYVTLDSAVVRSLDFGMLRADSTRTFTVINTGTGTLGVNVSSLDDTRLAINAKNLSIASGDSLLLDATLLRDDERQGEINEILSFVPTDERITSQSVAFNAYIIKSDAWAEDFEYAYVVEDDTYPRRFPEGWTTTGWILTQGGDDDMMSLFGGGDDSEKSWVAKTDSKEYEVVTPRLQAKKGHILRFTAKLGGGGLMEMLQMFGFGGASTSYLDLYYKRDQDKDWTLYNTYTKSDTILFKAPYSGFYHLKFQGSGVSLDDFLGFSLPKDSVILKDDYGRVSTLLSEQEGKIWNVVFERKLSAKANNDGTFNPVAATICLPYDFDIDDYYAPGTAKTYQMAYVDTYYNQFIFREMPDKMIQAGHPYMIIVSKGDVNFNAIDAKLTNFTNGNVPVYDYKEWRLNENYSQLGEWHGIFESRWANDTEYSMNDDGVWEAIMKGGSMNQFRSYLHVSGDLGAFWFKQIPDVSNLPTNKARSFDTKFYDQDENGNGDVVDIPNLLYIGDFTGDADGATGIVPTIRTIDRDGTENFFDLQGRRLNSKPNKGIYIENGKKYAK